MTFVHRRLFWSLAIVLTSVSAQEGRATITIQTVPIGNVGNLNDPQGAVPERGAVSYAYSIGKYEVTVGEYTAFLNAVAKSDPNALYNPLMGTDLNVKGIVRGGSSGNYSYSVFGSANKPVTYVSWSDAARFVNWMHNGQPTGSQNASTTENGVYPFTALPTVNITHWDYYNILKRNAGAIWALPSEDEWYKAAYHKNDGATDQYWNYPTSSDTLPYSDQPPGTQAPNPANTANFYQYGGTFPVWNNGYAATGSNVYSTSINYLTNVGAYTTAVSPYGTFDQGGNVDEITEGIEYPSNPNNIPTRILRGGTWFNNAGNIGLYMHAANGYNRINHDSESSWWGFRVAKLGDTVPVGSFGSPVVVDLGGGTSTVGGVSVGMTPSSTGTFQQSYAHVSPNNLPNTPEFQPGNYPFIMSGDTWQVWNLKYTGTMQGPATITFHVDWSLVNLGTPGIWHYDSINGWEYLGGVRNGDTITVTTNRFSPFVLGEPPQPETGDFNHDGIVDSADYAVWRKKPNSFPGNAYAIWRARFGNTVPLNGEATMTAVPEPGTWSLLCIATIFSVLLRRSGRRLN